MRYVAITLCMILMLSSLGLAIDSKINFRIYKKTLEEVLEKNAIFLSEYTSTPLGTADIDDISVKDATLTILPDVKDLEDLETKIKFVKGEGLELTLSDCKFSLTGKVADKPATLRGTADSLFFKLAVKNSEAKADRTVTFDASTLPKFDIENFDAKIDKDSLKWTFEGDVKESDGLKEETFTWIGATLKGQMVGLKLLANSAQQYIADYIESTVDPESFDGKISFSGIEFFDKYAELGVLTSYSSEDDEDHKASPSKELPEGSEDSDNAVEILFDENIINSGLHSAFHGDGEFALRSLLRIDDTDNEYGAMFDAMLVTNVVGQAWKEIEEEFGKDKK